MRYNMCVAVNVVAELDKTEQQEKENYPTSPAPLQLSFFL